MAKPSDKSKGVEEALDNIYRMIGKVSRTEAIEADKCAACGEEAVEFRDKLSKHEFTISGLCQKCQDSVFGDIKKVFS
jgi:hypothetical protein